jgi:hypothetical protein
MKVPKVLVLVAGVICTVLGAIFILLKDRVEGLLWFGILIQLLGMALGWMAWKMPRAAEIERPTPRQGAVFLVGVTLILLLQFAYFIWWSNRNR